MNITIAGNLTANPDLKYTPTGQPYVHVTVAENRSWKDQQGEWQEATSFFDVVCWRDLAENVVQSLEKGARVVVTGRIEQQTWLNEEGEKRSKYQVIADDLAPSLRFATAVVTKKPKAKNEERAA